jgi:hypothetical protein
MSKDASSPQVSTPASLTIAEQFMFKEYEQVCKENSERLKELWALEKFALGGAAVLASWLFGNVATASKVDGAWWLPFLFLALCGIRFGTGMLHLDKRAAVYTKKLEQHFLGENGGYETWFRPLPPNETWAYWAVWIIALGAALALASSHHG